MKFLIIVFQYRPTTGKRSQRLTFQSNGKLHTNWTITYCSHIIRYLHGLFFCWLANSTHDHIIIDIFMWTKEYERIEYHWSRKQRCWSAENGPCALAHKATACLQTCIAGVLCICSGATNVTNCSRHNKNHQIFAPISNICLVALNFEIQNLSFSVGCISFLFHALCGSEWTFANSFFRLSTIFSVRR